MDLSIEKCRQVLSVSKRASLKDVKEAYLDLAKVWHPDRFTGNPRLEKKATERLAEINSAYATLVAFYEAGGGEGVDAPGGDEGAASGEDVGAEEEVRKRPKGRGRVLGLLIVLCVVALAAGAYYFMVSKQRRSDVAVRVILPPAEPETGPQSAPPKKAVRSSSGPGSAGAEREEAPSKRKPPTRGGYFSLGSTKDAVLAVEGSPHLISDNRWNYGSSYVDFSKGRVIGWYNSALDPLRVRMGAGKDGEDGFFTLGSTREEVAAVQGTPMQVSGNRWSYGFSRVDFVRGRVAGWYNSALDPLRVKMTAKAEPERTFFAVGSTKGEVLAIQGTPTQLSESRWSYGYSYVDFENGKVVRWYNSEQDPLSVEEDK